MNQNSRDHESESKTHKRLRQKQKVRKDVTQKEGKTWEKIKNEEDLCENKDRWRNLIVREPTYSGNVTGRRKYPMY
jgi:hypothetical protein